MGAQSQTLAGRAAPFTIEHKGKIYKLRMIDNSMLSAIERKLYTRDLEAIALQKGIISDEDFNAKMAKAERDYLDGEYHLMSDKAREFFKKDIGLIFFMELLFQEPILNLVGLIQERQEELRRLVSTVLFESMPDVDFNKMEVKDDSQQTMRVHGPLGDTLTTEEIRAAGVPKDPKR